MAKTTPGRRSYVRPLLVILLLSLCLTLWLDAQTQAYADSFRQAPKTPVVQAATNPPPAAPAPAATAATTPAVPAPFPAPASASASTPAPAPVETATRITLATAQATPAATGIAAAPTSASAAEAQLTLVMRTSFTNVGTSEVRSGYVDVPLLSYTRGSAQEVLSELITPAPLEIREDEFGNRVGRFSLADIPAGGTLVIRQEYRIASGGPAGSRTTAEPRPEHLLVEPKIEVGAPEIQALAGQLARAGGGPLALALRIAERTRTLIRYDANSPTRNQGALAALLSGSGVCEEYATLFTALCRAAGLPARVVHGFARDRDSAQAAWTGIADAGVSLAPYRHAWAEVYIAGQGWFAVDPTYNRTELESKNLKTITPGTYIIESYINSPVAGRYVGGKLQAERSETLGW